MPDDPLQLDTRRRLYEIIRESPGLHFRELQRKSAMPTGTMEYALSCLMKSGLIEEHSEGHHLSYFASAKFSVSDKAMLSAMRREVPRGVVLWLIEHPGSTHKQILSAFTFTAPTLTYHLKRLVGSGVLVTDRAGNMTAYKVKDLERVVNLLIVYKRSFADKLVDTIVSTYVRGVV